MPCSMCGKNRRGLYTRDGAFVCEECLKAWPESVRIHLSEFSLHQLMKMEWVVHPYVYRGERCASLAEMLVTENSLVMNGYEYPADKIKRVALKFHPKQNCSMNGQQMVSGTLNVTVWTKSPFVRFEEPIEAVRCGYAIDHGRLICSIDSAVRAITEKINKALIGKRPHVSGAAWESLIDELCQYGFTPGVSGSAYGERRKTENREENRENRGTSDDGRREQEKRSSAAGSDLDRALVRFRLTRPFTEKDLNRAWHQLLARERPHPDQGGTDEEFREVQEMHDLLSRYAG